MSKRAEEAALKAHPVNMQYSTVYDCVYDLAQIERKKFLKVYEQAEKDLGWHSVDECLPPIDEEVIALSDTTRNGKSLPGADWICFAHIVDKKYCKDYNGWNIPGVKYWMPCPKIPEQ